MKNELIDHIIEMEWEMFTSVHNEGSRAWCQNDKRTFGIMRYAQAASYTEDLLLSYEEDLLKAKENGHNLMADKYGYMMKYTFPEEYKKICGILPSVSENKQLMIDEILKWHSECKKEYDKKYPNLSSLGRSDDASYGDTSSAVYLEGELKTYSERTLEKYMDYMKTSRLEGKNPIEDIMLETVRKYGYEDIRTAEEKVKVQ